MIRGGRGRPGVGEKSEAATGSSKAGIRRLHRGYVRQVAKETQRQRLLFGHQALPPGRQQPRARLPKTQGGAPIFTRKSLRTLQKTPSRDSPKLVAWQNSTAANVPSVTQIKSSLHIGRTVDESGQQTTFPPTATTQPRRDMNVIGRLSVVAKRSSIGGNHAQIPQAETLFAILSHSFRFWRCLTSCSSPR